MRFFSIFFLLFILMTVFSYEERDEMEFIQQELDFSFKVQSLSKYSRSVLNSPAFISIVFPIELRLFYYENVATLLNFSPGLYVVEDGTYWYLGSRGIQIPGSYNSRALFLLNGFPVNELVFGSPIDYVPNFLNSVEIVNGYSNVYSGSNSLVATINFIPYFLEDYDNKFEIDHNYYLFSGRAGTNSSIRLKLFNWLHLGTNFYSYPGRTIFLPQRNEYVINEDNRFSSFYHVFSRFSSLRSQTLFYFSRYLSRFHYPVGAFGITLNDRNDFVYNKMNHFFVKHSIDLPDYSSINLNLYYLDYDEYAQYPTFELGFINIDDLKNTTFSLDINYSKIDDRKSFLIGFEYKNVSYKLRNYDVDYFSKRFLTDYLNLSRSGLPILSLYLSYDYKFSIFGNEYLNEKYWLFSMSLRYDNYFGLYDDFRSIVVPQFSLIRVNGVSSLKFVYSQNYRVPSISEAFYNDGGVSTLSNPNLEPEKHKTFEIIYYKELKDKIKNGYFSFSFYNMDITNLINSVNVGVNSIGIEVSQYRNIGDIRVMGSMLDYVLYFKDREFVRFSYSYANARSIRHFSFLSNSPKHLILFKYAKRFSDSLWFSVESKWTSSVFDDYANKISSFNITNLNLIYEIDKHKRMGISIYNLFNTKADYVIGLSNNYPVSLYPIRKRTIYLNFNWKI